MFEIVNLFVCTLGQNNLLVIRSPVKEILWKNLSHWRTKRSYKISFKISYGRRSIYLWKTFRKNCFFFLNLINITFRAIYGEVFLNVSHWIYLVYISNRSHCSTEQTYKTATKKKQANFVPHKFEKKKPWKG